MKLKMLLVVVIVSIAGSAFAGLNGWDWSSPMTVKQVLTERTNAGKTVCRITTDGKDRNVDTWAVFMDEAGGSEMCNSAKEALVSGKKLQLRWCTNGCKKINYTYEFGASMAISLDNPVAVAINR